MKRAVWLLCVLCAIVGVSGVSSAPLYETAGSSLTATSRIYLPLASRATQKGIGYVSWWPGEYSHADSDLSLANLKATGATWISLLVTWYQDTYDSTTIYRGPSTPTDEDLAHAIATAHRLGLKVMLKPHVDPADYSFRGLISFDSETEWAAWFDSYRGFINHYAELARTNGVEQFSVGCELDATTPREAEWRQTIAGVRSRFGGPLTYACSSEWEVLVEWWDALDYIGVDAYYELTDKNDPTVAELKAAWAPRINMLSNLAARWGKPVLFSELGYCSKDGANRRPYDWETPGAVDLQEQADCYQAAMESLYGQPWFAGIYWQDWATDPFLGSECDADYTPHNKPAEDVLRAWFGGVVPRPAPLPAPLPGQGQAMTIYADELAPGWEDWSWDAEVALGAADQAYRGTRAIRVTLQAYGALCLWHPAFSTSGYHWIEFYVRAWGAEPELDIFLWDSAGTTLRTRVATDCRYVEGGAVGTLAWKRIIIPLSHLDAEGRSLSRLAIQDRSGRPSTTLWLDELRFVGQ